MVENRICLPLVDLRIQAHQRTKLIDLAPLDILDDTRKVRVVSQVATMQPEPRMVLVGILMDVIDTLRVEQRGVVLDALHLVAPL